MALLGVFFVIVPVLLWATLIMYGVSVLFWFYETLVLTHGWERVQTFEHSFDDIQVRILTVGAESVVQTTVSTVPDRIDDIHVIAERPIDIAGASVHVVPETFDTEAIRKGRALEWARQHVTCEKEYVLYLDEDTIVADFQGLPDGDVIQFTELPLYTGSWLTYLCEIFRVGYHLEQRAFNRLRYPLYAWGGGLAIRHELEQRLTWDVATVTEDTNFVWRASRRRDIDFRILRRKFRSQAPPSIRAMIKQRRRWLSGTRRDIHLLSLKYKLLVHFRSIVWAGSPMVPIVAITAYLFPGHTPGIRLYALISTGMVIVLFIYMAIGVRIYGHGPRTALKAIVATPIVVVLHAVGAMWGLVSPVEDFTVTEKIDPTTIERIHPGLRPNDLTDHSGTDPLVTSIDPRNKND